MKSHLLLLFILCVGVVQAQNSEQHFYTAASSPIRFEGRTLTGADGSVSFDWTGTYFTLRFSGTQCSMRVSDTGRNYYNLSIDGIPHGVVTTSGQEASSVVLAERLTAGEHTIVVQKRTEGEQGRTTLYGVETDGILLAAPAAPTRRIEFIGDSYTCGYGTEGLSMQEPFRPETENCDLGWACIAARYFDAGYTLIAHSGQGMVRNWGDSLQRSALTMKDRMLRTFDMESEPRWDFRCNTPDIVVIYLGSNDFSTEIEPAEEFFLGAYAVAINNLRRAYGSIPILCVAPSCNTVIYDYLRRFCAAQADENLHCVALQPSVMNWNSDLGSNFHPNHQGQRKLAMALIPHIATLMGWELPAKTVK